MHYRSTWNTPKKRYKSNATSKCIAFSSLVFLARCRQNWWVRHDDFIFAEMKWVRRFSSNDGVRKRDFFCETILFHSPLCFDHILHGTNTYSLYAIRIGTFAFFHVVQTGKCAPWTAWAAWAFVVTHLKNGIRFSSVFFLSFCGNLFSCRVCEFTQQKDSLTREWKRQQISAKSWACIA